MCNVRGMGVAESAKRVHVFAHFLQAFFVRDAEALLFVDDQQAKIVKLHVLRQQAVRADDDVHFSGFEVAKIFFCSRRRCGTGSAFRSAREMPRSAA